MSIKLEVPVTNKRVLEAIWQVYGMARIKQILDTHKGASFPGFALASALVDAEFAKARAEMSGEAFREVARAGHDIGKSLSVTIGSKNGDPVIEVEMPDLADAEP